jgi:hypothetical protein
MDAGVRVPARLAVNLCHVDFAAGWPADSIVTISDHPPCRPGSGREVKLDSGLEGAVILAEFTLRRQAGGGKAGVAASRRSDSLDDQMALTVQVAVRPAVRVGFQLTVVCPPPGFMIPFRRVRCRTVRPVEFVIEDVRVHVVLR